MGDLHPWDPGCIVCDLCAENDYANVLELNYYLMGLGGSISAEEADGAQAYLSAVHDAIAADLAGDIPNEDPDFYYPCFLSQLSEPCRESSSEDFTTGWYSAMMDMGGTPYLSCHQKPAGDPVAGSKEPPR